MGSRGSRLGAALVVLALCATAGAQADTAYQVSGGEIGSIACTGGSDCLATVRAQNGPQGSLVPITSGAPGSAVALPADFSPAGITCVSAGACLVVGAQYSGSGESATAQAGIVAVDNGAPGAVQIVPGASTLEAISCPTASSCIAVGGIQPATPGPNSGVVVPIENGKAGSPQPVSGLLGLAGIGCESTSSCIAVGSGFSGGHEAGFMVQITNGVAGSAQQVPGVSDLFGVACVAGTGHCLAAGQQINGGASEGVLVPINDRAAGAAELVASASSLFGVSCPSASTCVVSGVGGLQTGVPLAGGGIGSRHAVADAGAYLHAVACASETSCVAVGQAHTGSGVVIDLGGFPPPSTPTAALNQSLAVSGPSASIPAILSAGGFPASVSAPSSGTMNVVWYYLPRGARLAAVVKPVVVARGSKSFAAAGRASLKLRLTSAGRRLLKGSKRVKLTAVGTFAPKHGKPATKRKSITLK